MRKKDAEYKQGDICLIDFNPTIGDEIKKIREESEFYIGKPWPPALKRRLDNVVFGIEQERRSIEEKEEEIRRIIARFEADRQRYRALSEAAKNRPRH